MLAGGSPSIAATKSHSCPARTARSSAQPRSGANHDTPSSVFTWTVAYPPISKAREGSQSCPLRGPGSSSCTEIPDRDGDSVHRSRRPVSRSSIPKSHRSPVVPRSNYESNAGRFVNWPSTPRPNSSWSHPNGRPWLTSLTGPSARCAGQLYAERCSSLAARASPPRSRSWRRRGGKPTASPAGRQHTTPAWWQPLGM